MLGMSDVRLTEARKRLRLDALRIQAVNSRLGELGPVPRDDHRQQIAGWAARVVQRIQVPMQEARAV
jgi:hypothetical protein